MLFCESFLVVDQLIDLDSYSRSEIYVIEHRGKVRSSFSYFFVMMERIKILQIQRMIREVSFSLSHRDIAKSRPTTLKMFTTGAKLESGGANCGAITGINWCLER